MSPADSLQSILDALAAAARSRGYHPGIFVTNETGKCSYFPKLSPEVGARDQQINGNSIPELIAAVEAMTPPESEAEALAREILATEAHLQKLKAAREGRA